jgi:hypothetical protein
MEVYIVRKGAGLKKEKEMINPELEQTEEKSKHYNHLILLKNQ